MAAAMSPLAAAPTARADILDVVVDPIINRLQQAVAGVTDAVSAILPSAAVDVFAGIVPQPDWPVWTSAAWAWTQAALLSVPLMRWGPRRPRMRWRRRRRRNPWRVLVVGSVGERA